MLIIDTPEFLLFTLILMRMSGFVLFNPILGRRNIPAIYKAGLTLALTFIIYPTASFRELTVTTSIMYSLLLLKEFFLGYVIGLTMQIFEMVVTMAGSVIDFQIGLSMANVFDAESGVQISLTSAAFQVFYLLLFFATDAHLALIKILVTSEQLVPYVNFTLGPQVIDGILIMFTHCVTLGATLAIPIIAFEFIVQVATGLLMRMIPQINLFILSIQLRVIVGIFMLVFMISPIGDFLVDVVTQVIGNLQNILTMIGS